MDLNDIGGNVRDSLHVAALGGTWMALVCSFAGLRDQRGRLDFRPYLPDGWTRIASSCVRSACSRWTFAAGRRYRLLEAGAALATQASPSVARGRRNGGRCRPSSRTRAVTRLT
jgi:trehalose/maltose hydrolase-like predicted phosphorylase